MSKTALVTGASSGIGEAIALQLIRAGFRVYGTSRSARESKPEGIQFVQMNVDDDDSVKTAISQLMGNIDRLDVVVNCAGLGILGAIEEIPIATAKQIFETNFFGVMRVCKAVAPIMRKQKSGHIIQISSIAGEVSLPLRGIYSASKFAMEAMTEAMRMELKPFGVQMAIVQPGDFNTALGQNRTHVDPDPESPYELFFKSIEAQIQEGMSNAPTPEPVGRRIEKIAKNNHPRLRYRVGSMLEVITPRLRKALPGALYERLMMGFYKMNDKNLMK
jgi:NAD(P)-dependent dehydrogenase (short-subunit alcohol dehydrogenase family)